MKKVISKILILVILISFIVPKFTFATETTTSDEASESDESDYNVYKSLAENGKVNVNGEMQDIPYTSRTDIIAAVLATVTSAIAEITRGVISACVNEGDISKTTNFTIGQLLSGQYDILNNDFLLTSNNSTANNTIKEQVTKWYYGIRTLAIIISLLMLIYIGIRMAISTLAEDKAKYSKMLIGWLQGFILIFFLHYIMIIAMAMQKVFMEVINYIKLIDGQAERDIIATCWSSILKDHGWNIVWSAILYWVLTYYQIKFFLLYAKRMVSTAFLMVIAPLITVTYSVDKAGDGKAQAFESWLKEFLVNVFIQSVHLILYIIFIVTASEIATKVPLLTIIFFGALSRGEKIIKGVFGMRGMKSIHSMGKGKKK